MEIHRPNQGPPVQHNIAQRANTPLEQSISQIFQQVIARHAAEHPSPASLQERASPEKGLFRSLTNVFHSHKPGAEKNAPLPVQNIKLALNDAIHTVLTRHPNLPDDLSATLLMYTTTDTSSTEDTLLATMQLLDTLSGYPDSASKSIALEVKVFLRQELEPVLSSTQALTSHEAIQGLLPQLQSLSPQQKGLLEKHIALHPNLLAPYTEQERSQILDSTQGPILSNDRSLYQALKTQAKLLVDYVKFLIQISASPNLISFQDYKSNMEHNQLALLPNTRLESQVLHANSPTFSAYEKQELGNTQIADALSVLYDLQEDRSKKIEKNTVAHLSKVIDQMTPATRTQLLQNIKESDLLPTTPTFQPIWDKLEPAPLKESAPTAPPPQAPKTPPPAVSTPNIHLSYASYLSPNAQSFITYLYGGASSSQLDELLTAVAPKAFPPLLLYMLSENILPDEPKALYQVLANQLPRLHGYLPQGGIDALKTAFQDYASSKQSFAQLQDTIFSNIKTLNSTINNCCSEPIPMQQVIASFSHNKSLVEKFTTLEKKGIRIKDTDTEPTKFASVQSIRGDGNCYYRSVLVGMGMDLIAKGNQATFGKIADDMEAAAKKFPGEIPQVKDAVAALRSAAQGNQWKTVPEFLEYMNLNPHVDLQLIMGARYLLADWIKTHKDHVIDNGLPLYILIEQGFDIETTVDDYLKNNVLQEGHDAEGPIVDMGILGILFNIDLNCVFVDRKETVALGVRGQSLNPTRTIEDGKVKTPLTAQNPLAEVYVLLQPGHYDLLNKV